MYRTINQVIPIDNTNIVGNDYVAMEVSFWMKTIEEDISGEFPSVESAIHTSDYTSYTNSNPGNFIDEDGNQTEQQRLNTTLDIKGKYNSILSGSSGESDYNYFGSGGRFANTKLNTWEKMTYSFNLTPQHLSATDSIIR